MSNNKIKRAARPSSPPLPPPAPGTPRSVSLWIAAGVSLVVLAGVAMKVLNGGAKNVSSNEARLPLAVVTGSTATATVATLPPVAVKTNEPAPPPRLEVATAVMVTVELDFGTKMPSIAEAVRDIERRHQPDDGVGRTFAILDAYGEPTPDGKKLHISMHVSAEKPGLASLVFKRTGEVLWASHIVPNTNKHAGEFTGKNLLIYLESGTGQLWTVDGSSGPASILDANVKELGTPIAANWPDGTEREFTFMYSACGCPVKAMVRREGDRTVRTKELPVIFPDDPTVVTVITRLMRW